MKNIALVAQAALLSFGAASCFAGNDNPCQKIEQYYSKSNVEVVDAMKKSERPQRADDIYNATQCLSNIDNKIAAPFQINGTNVDLDKMKLAAQRVLKAETELNSQAQEQNLKDFNFAVGLGMLFLRNESDLVETTVDNGTLRTTSEERYKLGIWLSSNSFLYESTQLRYGLFFATQLGGSSNNDLLNSFAIGLSFTGNKPMSAYKQTGTAPLVFQVGYGFTHIQTLADGYSNGMTLPAGTNQPIMKKTIGKGPVVLVSTAF